MFKFNVTYFILTILLFLTEILIGVYMHDAFIRPYGGDFLVVILMYCFVKSFVNTGVTFTAIGVLLFAYVIEILQYFHIVNLLGLQNNKIACMLMGTYFNWTDMLMYTLGILMVWFIEIVMLHKPR